MPPSVARARAFALCVLVTAYISRADAFGPRPRPRLYSKPHLPPHLLAAEQALKELAPGGPCAAGLLTDGRWRSNFDPDWIALNDGDASDAKHLAQGAAGADSQASTSDTHGHTNYDTTNTPTGASVTKSELKKRRAANAKKYEEYFLRHKMPTKLAKATRDDHEFAQTVSHGESTGGDDVALGIGDKGSYVLEISGADGVDADASGVVPVNKFGALTEKKSDDVFETALNAFDRPDGALQKAQDPSAFPDQSTHEMMLQLKKEADAYVNPQTGNAVRWGDTWRHEWGGGVGVGRVENRQRRMMEDGTTQIVPDHSSKNGYQLVPTSTDKRALEEFYDECNGVRWSVQKNWGVGEPCANGWHGVVCVGSRVTELWMNLNNVACWGKFNLTALSRLDELRYLDLSDNLFSGEIPSELFQMKKLQSLVLSSNRLTGTLSPEFGTLTSLRHLDLSANGLSGALPPEFSGMKSLEVLYLGEAGLENRNNFGGRIPVEWADLKNLRRLSLSGNNLITGKFPPWLGTLSNLEELTLSGCSLTGALPTSIGTLRHLRLLDLSGNKLVGLLPEGVSSLTKLKHLKLHGNKLTGHVLGTLPLTLRNLETLDLGGNRLTGGVPSSFSAFGKLEYLDLSRNKLTGPVPKSLKHVTSLRTVLLHENQFTGPVPGWLFVNLPSLMHLYLDNNLLTGKLPGAEIAGAALLKELHLGNNRFVGAIPAGIFDAPRLASLRLRGNKLTGSIPHEIGRAVELARLDLSHNSLTGTIPASIANATELAEVRLSHNKLEGPLPSRSLRELPMLRELHVNNNLLVGSVPAWLAQHECLRHVDLSNNKLSGLIPQALWDELLDDGDGGFGAVPKLPARHDRYANEESRVVSLGKNPFFCPIADWARDELQATCVFAEVLAIDPSFGPRSGGTEIVVTGTNFPVGVGEGDDGDAWDGQGVEFGDDVNWDTKVSPNSSPNSLGCLFSSGGGASKEIWRAATRSDETSVTCVTPPKAQNSATNTVVVRVGVGGTQITRFGELFVYK